MAARMNWLWRVLWACVSIGALGGVLSVGMAGCEEETPADSDTVRVNIDGRDFFLELSADNPTRLKGLSEREHIEPDGGMLFAFRQPAVRAFVMRDCFVPIDIIYLDGSGRVVKMYTMEVEPPRDPDGSEGQVGETNANYEQRLKKYSSRFGTQFVIELAGHTIDTLDISEGDLIKLDTDALERRAR